MVHAELFPAIAARASNLVERARVVAALGRPVDAFRLDAFESWKIDVVAGKLAEKYRQESFRRAAHTLYDNDELVELLTTYAELVAAAERTDADLRQRLGKVLGEIHADWLPTYRTVVERFDDARENANSAVWAREDLYYGRNAVVCAPFVAELERQLRACRRDTGGGHGIVFAETVVDDFLTHYLNRFEVALTWAVEADSKVYRARAGVSGGTSVGQQEYLAYLRTTFSDSQSYDSFYCRFPLLARWLAHVTAMLGSFGQMLIQQLRADAGLLGDTLFGQRITEIAAIELGNSDYHAGGRSVAFVEVLLADGTRADLVYKPHCIRSAAAMQTLLSRLRDEAVLDFAPRAVLAFDDYGYEARIPAGHNQMESVERVESVYAELGGYLALFYILGGSDLHFENVLIADGHAHICDCETVLGVVPKKERKETGTLLDSVFRTGLLEWPRAQQVADLEMRISGYGGGESYELPIPVAQITGEAQTFGREVRLEGGVRVDPNPSNRVFLGDELVRPEDHGESIARGFDRVYRWFQRYGETASEWVTELFAGTSTRFVNRSTQTYGQLLLSARHPKVLSDPLELDVLSNTMRTYPRRWDPQGVLTERELSSLWRMDVPIFTSDSLSGPLVHDHTDEVALDVEMSPVEQAVRRIGALSEQNRDQQVQYVNASLTTNEVLSPSFTATALDYAARLGNRLHAMLREEAAPAPWIAYDLDSEGITETDIEGDLYQGSAGITFFLAYLDHLAPDPRFRAAAERGLEHSLRTRYRNRIGAFGGTGGLIYLLTHLHALWGQDDLLATAADLVEELPAGIERDRHHDVFAGAAGLIPVLLGFADRAGGHGLRYAQRIGDRLLAHAEAEDETVSWPPFDHADARMNLTGFAHGAGGIGWALIELGARLDRPDYIEVGNQAFAYEARYFDQDEQDWPDLRVNSGGKPRDGRHFANAWCNGAAGIGLSRIASWAALGRQDDDLLGDARLALLATLRNLHRLGNDTLCHGACGNAELLLRFGLLADEPAFHLEANVQVREQWRNVENAAGDPGTSASFFPGLMLGISGFGMHFLRLAEPERVPSVLLLDPPR